MRRFLKCEAREDEACMVLLGSVVTGGHQVGVSELAVGSTGVWSSASLPGVPVPFLDRLLHPFLLKAQGESAPCISHDTPQTSRKVAQCCQNLRFDKSKLPTARPDIADFSTGRFPK